MIQLSFQSLKATIDPQGAQLKSYTLDGKEFLRHGKEDVWQSTAPILFPICGGLLEDYFIKDGKKYPLPKHGFISTHLFSVVQVSASRALLETTLLPGEEEMYPYPFLFRVEFSLGNDGLSITYYVKNTGSEKMYFSFGSHEGYSLPAGLSATRVTFAQKETVPVYSVDGSCLDGKCRPFLENQDSFTLEDSQFIPDALIFKDLQSRRLTMETTDRRITLSFPGFDYLLIWSAPGARFACLEPWCGMPDSTSSRHILSEREGILSLLPGEELSRTHTILIEALPQNG